MPALKICGLTDPDQALAIAKLGADAIGVIGVAGTPRYVAEAPRRTLFEHLKQQAPGLERVWVVANADQDAIDAALCGEGVPTVVQLHGDESPDFCLSLRQRHPDTQFWKALRLRNPDQLQSIPPYSQAVDALLLDAWNPDQLGGTGHRLPLEWLTEATIPVPWWLAGGVSAEWIPDLLAQMNPNGLDASSRLEIRPGWKDLSKVAELVDAIRCSAGLPAGGSAQRTPASDSDRGGNPPEQPS
jgi:phosphoribosylanthranilate isomerase